MLNPRALIAQVLPLDWATCMQAVIRRASGRLVAPERRMSSPVITVIAAAASETGSLRRETEVTSISINSSMLRLLSSDDWAACSSWTALPRNGGQQQEDHQGPRDAGMIQLSSSASRQRQHTSCKV